ncbi:transposase [Dethiobacter alkaliphilus]|nr:transposase [Dethiobacter alkaliphilus]
MARRRRIHYPGAIYHIITRGNNKNKIFSDEQDYKKQLLIYKDHLAPFEIDVLSYALLPNHTHLLAQVGNYELGYFMKMVQQRYTQYYNKKTNSVGHVYQGRYTAFLVKDLFYLKQLIAYINLNAKKANLEQVLGQYRWTSHYEIVNNKPFILNKAKLLRHFDNDYSKAMSEYLALLSADSNFDPEIDDYYEKDESGIAIPKNKEVVVRSLDDLAMWVAWHFNIEPRFITFSSKARNIVMARRVLIFLARYYFSIPGKEVAEFLSMTEQYVAVTTQKAWMNKDTETKKIAEAIWCEMLND